MTDRFSMYDAAYLLGSLTPQDRAEFEAHLAECADCRRAVNQLAGMPGLLASVAPEHQTMDVASDPPLPDTLLPRLLAEVQRTRFRRRMTTGLVGVAAAAILVVALLFGVADAPDVGSPQSPQTAAVAMIPVTPNLPVHAKVQLASKQWGTEVKVWCTYEGEPGHSWDGPITYTLYVTDVSGASQQIGAWDVRAGQPVVADGFSSVPESQIASIEIRGPSEQPLLSYKP